MVMPPSAADIDARAQKVRVLLLDVDGVLTDGRLLYLPDGQEARVFNGRDGLGIQLLRASGLKVGMLSGKQVEVIRRRGEELGVELLLLGIEDKVAAFDQALEKLGVKAEEVCYVGDDLPDLPLIRKAGLGCAVADAAPEVRANANIILRANGGQGAVREVCERLLKAKGNWRV
jgi:3-deoxy-D-manno-octulosonate 8-phosphate phosphatase (KDO 8-P phosphatase)